MKTFHLNHLKSALICVLFLIFQSCAHTVPGSWKNGKINSGKLNDFHQLNTEVLKILKANEPKRLKSFLSKAMIESNNERDIEHISNHLNDNVYELLDEYYVIHKYKDTDTVRVANGDINRYALLYPYTTTEMYMAFLVPKKSNNKDMISLVYGKFDYGWKIIKLEVSPYTINGKTAPELYALARNQAEKGHFQAALNNLQLAFKCFKPGSYWQYPDEGDAGKLYTNVHGAVKLAYRFPIVLSQIPTGPMLTGVYIQKTDDGTFPAIYYMTHYDLKDTVDIKKENLQVRRAIEKMMPGMHEGNKCILYSAYNKMPTGYVSIDHFDMIDRTR
ncbi:MAG: hypothetical protein JWR02_2650 [Mucilaginibacter sp.]|nr:hypothetical protein [Mucilaginibacter sp.]